MSINKNGVKSFPEQYEKMVRTELIDESGVIMMVTKLKQNTQKH